MATEVKDQTNLVKRGRIYYLRVRIPADLKEHYGRAEIWRSLRTSDPSVARERVRVERLKLDQEFHQARAVQSPAPVEDLSDLEIDRLAAMWNAHLVEEDEAARMDGMTDRAFSRHGETLDLVTAGTAHQLARGQVDDFLADEMGDFLQSHGIKVQEGTEAWRRLAFAFLKAHRRALDAMNARQRGEVVDTPKPEPLVIRSLPDSLGDTLEALLGYWKSQGKKRPRSIQETESAISALARIAPGVPASKIAKRHVVALKDKLLETDAAATVKKKLGLVKAVFQVATDNEKLQANPAAGVKVAMPKVRPKSRVPFELADLQAIFGSEVFTKGKRPTGGAGEAAYWLPLLALFTGARLEELGQLLAADVKEADGIRYLDIADNPESGKTIKTNSSRRRVPLHPELLRLGFLGYVGGMRQQGQARIFPHLKSKEGRQLTASYSKWFGRYLRKVAKVGDPRKVFHSFRHGFKAAGRECGISKEHLDRIQGHDTKDVGDDYGGEHFPLAPLVNAIGRLAYKGLDLSNLSCPGSVSGSPLPPPTESP